MRGLREYKLELCLSLLGVLLAAQGDLFLPRLLSDIINNGVTSRDTGYILQVGGIMLAVTLLSVGASVAGAYYSARMAAGFARNLRAKLFRKVESFSAAEMDRFGTASLITRTTGDVLQMQNYLFALVRILVRSPMMAAGGLIFAYGKSPALARPLLVTIPIIVLLLALISRRVIPISKTLQLKIDSVNRVMREKLTGIRVIRAFGAEDYEERRFDGVNRDLTGVSLKMARTMTLLMPALMLAMNLTTVAIVWFGGVQVDLGGGLMAGDIIAVIQYVMQIMFALVMMSMVFIMYPRAAASAARLVEVLEASPSITDPEQPAPPPILRGRVEFRDVSFTFPGAEDPALRHISFTTGPGEITAIIGGTGSGKTSLLSLILRFYDVTEGQVLVDGVDVRAYRQAELRARIGYASQKAMLFSGTIESNIRFGQEELSGEQLRQAAGTAQALPFIEEKEGGFEAAVSQGGQNLSGGQRQRLSIARAIARDPEIYLFDDSFSALDYKTDANLRAALRERTAGATVLIVAQRISTIRNADRILVLDHGALADMGTHRELLARCEIYREIVSSQFTEEEVAG